MASTGTTDAFSLVLIAIKENSKCFPYLSDDLAKQLACFFSISLSWKILCQH